MKFTSILQYSFITGIAIAVAPMSLAKADSIQSYDKSFNYEWNKFSTLTSNKNTAEKAQAFVKTITDYNNLSLADRQSLGSLLYKLGTYYAHVTHDPDLAIKNFQSADLLLLTKQDKAWNDSQLAFAYEQKYASSGQPTDRAHALEYINTVLSELYPNTKNKVVAFAYCVKGLIYKDGRDFARAEASYKVALNIYDELPDGKDEQYARTKSYLSKVMLAQN